MTILRLAEEDWSLLRPCVAVFVLGLNGISKSERKRTFRWPPTLWFSRWGKLLYQQVFRVNGLLFYIRSHTSRIAETDI